MHDIYFNPATRDDWPTSLRAKRSNPVFAVKSNLRTDCIRKPRKAGLILFARDDAEVNILAGWRYVRARRDFCFSASRKGMTAMPFVFDWSEIDLPDDYSHKADDFVFMNVAEFNGGNADRVRFGIQPRFADLGRREPLGGPREWFARLFGPKPDLNERMRKSGEVYQNFHLAVFATIMRELVQLGIVKAYCRYDGGSDEGFAHAGYFETGDGRKLNLDELILILSKTSCLALLQSIEKQSGYRHQKLQQNPFHKLTLKQAIEQHAIYAWAEFLMDGGYGDGEMSLYGAFTVDLLAQTITDDPDADFEPRFAT